MWADPLLLRIGGRGDLLVAVQPDGNDSADRLRTLFGNWLEPEFASAAPAHRPALKVRLAAVGDRDRPRTPGPRPVPQLLHGSCLIARSRRPDDIVGALASLLGGAHLQRRDDGRLWIAMRAFARDGAIVLVDAEQPTLVNDRRLAELGIDELPVWSVAIEADGSVAVPPPLPRLDWQAIGAEPPHDGWRRYDLAGIAVLGDAAVEPANAVAELARHSHQARWRQLVSSLDEHARLSPVEHHGELRSRIATLLEPSG